jgi:hypothetical protein
MKGLYLDKPLSLDMTKHATMCPEMKKEIIAEFKNTIGITLYTDVQYHAARLT